MAFVDDFQTLADHAFLFDMAAVGRHRAGGNAADIGMMAARSSKKQQLLTILRKHRRYHGNVRQMRAACIGRIEQIDVAGLQTGGVFAAIAP